MRTIDIIAGMQLLMKYYVKPDGYFTAADDEQLWMDSLDIPITKEDFDKLCALGWDQRDSPIVSGAHENSMGFPYSGWKCFT